MAPDGAGAAGGWRFLPALVAAAATAWFASLLSRIVGGEAPEIALRWVPALDVDLAFRLDGLALAFALLISGIGALVLLYAATYFRADRRLGALLLTLSLFAASMLGLVTADDAVTLFVFWEGTTITSWLLVGFDHGRAEARAAALQALLVTALGGLALLAGLLVMGGVAGTWRLSGMNAAGDLLRTAPAYPAILVLVALAAFTKSAQWPFHFWLPNAMAAPIPVSAYLHSATMVKAGVYLLARLSPALGGTGMWTALLCGAGGVTMLLGAVWALRQTDLKLMLAWTTLMALGLLTLLLGIGTPAAVTAAMVFLVVHAFYKAALFLAVGMLDKGAGSRAYPALGGLARAMPVTAAATGLAALSMAGLPPFVGFIGKELTYAATGAAATMAALGANALVFAAAATLALRPFAGPRRSPAPPHDPGFGLAAGPVVLAALGLAVGLVPSLLDPLAAAMTRAVAGRTPEAHLALWHGPGAPLLLSLATFAAGFLLYARLDRLRDTLAAAEPRLPRTEAWYDAALGALARAARGTTRTVQGGRMTVYLTATFLVLALLVWGAILTGRARWPAFALPGALMDWAVAGIILASIAVVVLTPSRLTAIAALGGIGAGIAIIFVLYGAIDVAMTQLFVEILVVVFLAIAMVRLPRSGEARFRPGHALVAILLGSGVTVAILSVLGGELDLTLTRYFEAESVTAAFGHNIVNVILVDFRGFDTLGEISVIVIAGLAATAALRARRAG